MRSHWRYEAVALAALLMLGCSNDSGPGVSPLIITKATTNSGDGQTGPAGQLLPNALRVEVTRDGDPASNVTVTWSTGSGGSLTPASELTHADGSSSSIWTLGPAGGGQSATAKVEGTGPSSIVTFTAIATGGAEARLVQVISQDAQGGNRFVPANLTVVLGTTVTWQWVDNIFAHNVVPDDGSTPAQSGTLITGPHTYEYTFNALGTYHYHCQLHGGSGMVGTITVVATAP